MDMVDRNDQHVDKVLYGDEDEEENSHIINGSNNLACQQERHAGAKTVQHLQLSTGGFVQPKSSFIIDHSKLLIQKSPTPEPNFGIRFIRQ